MFTRPTRQKLNSKTLAFVLLVLLTGCGRVNDVLSTPQATQTSSAPPSTQKSPTALAGSPTFESSPGPPTNTPLIASPLPGTTIVPTATAVPLIDPETKYPEAVIQIYRPGPFSKVTSPFQLVANLPPGDRGQVKLELLGEDGRLLVRKIVYLTTIPGYSTANLVEEFTFEIPGLAESARLSISIDDEYGRTSALASVNLVLLSTGLTENNPYVDLQQDVIIQQPAGNTLIQGDELLVTGLARTEGIKPLLVELIDREGRVLGWSQASVVKPEGEEYGLFAARIPFNIEEPTWVLVVVTEFGDKIPGIAYISSVEIVLSPKP